MQEVSWKVLLGICWGVKEEGCSREGHDWGEVAPQPVLGNCSNLSCTSAETLSSCGGRMPQARAEI
jgi:hypothetical protein